MLVSGRTEHRDLVVVVVRHIDKFSVGSHGIEAGSGGKWQWDGCHHGISGGADPGDGTAIQKFVSP